MHATQIAKPFHREGWIYEEKYDGRRVVAIKAEGAVRLVSRKGRDLTARFPELVTALRGLKPTAFILDGEVAVYDRAFVSRFEWLHRRPKDEPARRPVYMVFDLLELDGRDLRGEPLPVRRRLLAQFIHGHGMIFLARRLVQNGLKAWEAVRAPGYEGLVAKDPASLYVGGRSLCGSRSSSRSTARVSAGGRRKAKDWVRLEVRAGLGAAVAVPGLGSG